MKLYKHATVQNLARLSFLTDCIFFDKTHQRISGFSYRLYIFGPFDESIFACLENLINAGLIRSYLNYTRTGLEYVSYVYNDRISDLKFKAEYLPTISIVEFHLMREILYELMNYGDRRLTEMVYKSKPIRSQGVLAPGELGAAGQVLSFEAPVRLA